MCRLPGFRDTLKQLPYKITVWFAYAFVWPVFAFSVVMKYSGYLSEVLLIVHEFVLITYHWLRDDDDDDDDDDGFSKPHSETIVKQ